MGVGYPALSIRLTTHTRERVMAQRIKAKHIHRAIAKPHEVRRQKNATWWVMRRGKKKALVVVYIVATRGRRQEHVIVTAFHANRPRCKRRRRVWRDDRGREDDDPFH